MRLIDADATMQRLKEWNTDDPMDKALYNFAVNRINEQPTIEERKKGKWTMLPNGNALCSECGYMQVHVWDLEGWDNFCHHCGADMRGEQDDEQASH